LPRQDMCLDLAQVAMALAESLPALGALPIRGDMMGADRALSLLNEMLWASLLVAGPVLIATLVVGIMISVFQVTTQLQEITLSYVPKILVAAFLLIAIGPWMIGRVTQFATSLYLSIPTIAG
jgi:flagellar biosynthetic protein FliQ